MRAKVQGSAERPRLSVFRSASHLYTQLIDDVKGGTLASARDTELKAKGGKTEQAKALGQLIAQRAKEQGITQAVFDKGSYQYHGRVRALAEGAREAGLKI